MILTFTSSVSSKLQVHFCLVMHCRGTTEGMDGIVLGFDEVYLGFDEV